VSWEWTPDTLAALAAFFAERGLSSGPLRTQAIGDGHSNLTFLVTDGDRSFVVRRPPPFPVPPGGHDMLREARLIEALAGSGVPVPMVLAVAQAGEVLDVPFYVMSHVDGIVATTETPAALRSPGHTQALTQTLIDTLAALHRVDWRAAGLNGFGRPAGFNARHLQRMLGVVADDDGCTPAAFAGLAEWLADSVPAESGAGIVHNDFRLGNVILGRDAPARILAVLDWELATIGDPLLDLGYFLVSCPRAGEPLTPTQDLATALLHPGLPSNEELAERYAEATGTDVSNLAWYMTMALWKLAVLYEYGLRRFRTGHGDPYYADPNLVQRFLAAAHRTAGLEVRS
jgi:aminoglycoside phosphotransferase (APT) family kinase protein